MSDMQYWPKKFEEYINSYSFKDGMEVYTNGGDLIPVFRVMDAYEHYCKPESVISKDPLNYKFDLQPYCTNCPAFEAKQKDAETFYFDDEPISRVHTITCQKKALCENIYKYLERKSK